MTKRLMWCVIGVFVIVAISQSAAFPQQTPVQQNQQVIDNMEDVSGWQVNPKKNASGTIKLSPEPVKDGSFSAKLTYNFKGESNLARFIKPLTGKVRDFTDWDGIVLWIYAEGDADTAFHIDLPAGEKIQQTWRYTINVLDWNGWKRIYIDKSDFTVRGKGQVQDGWDDIASIQLFFLSPTQEERSGSCYVDSIAKVKNHTAGAAKTETTVTPADKESAKPTVDAEVKTSTLQQFSKTTFQGAPYLIRKLNLLTDYSFEEGTAEIFPDSGWFHNHNPERPLNATRGIWDTTEAHTGTRSAKIEVQGGTGKWVTEYMIPLKGGKSYLLRGWYKSDKGGRAWIAGYAVQFEPEKGIYKQYVHIFEKGIGFNTSVSLFPAKEWTPFELKVNVPSERGEYWVRVYLSGTGRNSNTWYDDVSFVPAPSFTIIDPNLPVTAQQDSVFSINVAVLDSEANPVDNCTGWKAWADGKPIQIDSSKFNSDLNVWQITMTAPDSKGFHPLKVQANVAGTVRNFQKDRYLYVIPPVKGTFAFAVIADTHVVGYPIDERDIMAQDLINSLDPTVVLNLGDLANNEEAYDVEQKTLFSAYETFVRGFHMPVYSVAGNHDPDMPRNRSRWYYRRYAGVPYFYSFDVDSFHFIGLDSVLPGSTQGTHGGDFVVPGQVEWLEKDIKQADEKGLKSITFFHHPIYYPEFKDSEARRKALDLFFKYGVSFVLAGHHHGSFVVVKKNPYFTGTTDLKEVELHGYDTFDLDKRYFNNPAFVIFYTLTSPKAFLREDGYNGFRYIWIKDGKVAYNDTLPNNFIIERKISKPTRKVIHIANPAKETSPYARLKYAAQRDFNSLPLRFEMEKGFTYRAFTEDGQELPITQIQKGNMVECWVEVDIKNGQSKTIEVTTK